MAGWSVKLEKGLGTHRPEGWVAIYTGIVVELERVAGGDAEVIGATALPARLREARARLRHWRSLALRPAASPAALRARARRWLTA